MSELNELADRIEWLASLDLPVEFRARTQTLALRGYLDEVRAEE